MGDFGTVVDLAIAVRCADRFSQGRGSTFFLVWFWIVSYRHLLDLHFRLRVRSGGVVDRNFSDGRIVADHGDFPLAGRLADWLAGWLAGWLVAGLGEQVGLKCKIAWGVGG